MQVTKKITNKLETNFYNNQFTGLLVINPKTKDTIISYNSDKYFTPASNTKIITLYAALQFLGDSLPAFKYTTNKDTIFLIGTGNPTYLHSYFKDSTTLNFTKNYQKVKLIQTNIVDKKFGPGWAWEDYDTYFSPERSSFPIYGNVVSVSNNGSLQSMPEVLLDSVKYQTKQRYRRDLNGNQYYYPTNRKDTIEIPILLNKRILSKLWKGVLKKEVSFTNEIPKDLKVVYGIKSDTLYKRMMHKSDNFLAEQMLLMASSTLSDTLNSKRIRSSILNNQLKNLAQKPRWVDGSGLSRYNLFTPNSFVFVLNELYTDLPKERLYTFFPVWDYYGSFKTTNKSDYIHAKTGYLSNNFCLSGYLETKKGEILIFSFMNNHFKQPTSKVKENMRLVLESLYVAY